MRQPDFQTDGISLYLGDCRDALAGLEADLLLTDPPYGIGAVKRITDELHRNALFEPAPKIVQRSLLT